MQIQGDAASPPSLFFNQRRVPEALHGLYHKAESLQSHWTRSDFVCLSTNINQAKHTYVETALNNVQTPWNTLLFHQTITVAYMNEENLYTLYTFCNLAPIPSQNLRILSKPFEMVLQLIITETTTPSYIFFLITVFWRSEGFCAFVCDKPQS